MKGAFAGSAGLKLSKEEKREELEIKELKRLATPPSWASYGLLAGLCADAKANAVAACRLKASPIDCHDAIVRSRTIAKLEAESESGGTPWYAIIPPPKLVGGERLEAIVCLAKDGDKLIYGAIGWFPVEKLKAGTPLQAADAVKVVRLDGSEYPSCMIGHPTILGVGENHKAPVPASSDLDMPVALQLCESFREYHVAKAQVNARLARGGAGEEEKSFVKSVLFVEALSRLRRCANADELPVDDLNRTESAVQGIRKCYMPRDWQVRCTTCKMRHFDMEKGTCKFWVKFAAEALEQKEKPAE